MAGIGMGRIGRPIGKLRGSRRRALLACMLLAGMTGVAQAADTHAAAFSQQGDAYQFGNDSIVTRWKVADGKLADMVVVDEPNHQELPVTAPVELTMADGSKLGMAQLKLLEGPEGQQAEGQREGVALGRAFARQRRAGDLR